MGALRIVLTVIYIIICAEQDPVAAVFQFLAQGAPFGKAGTVPGDGEKGRSGRYSRIAFA